MKAEKLLLLEANVFARIASKGNSRERTIKFFSITILIKHTIQKYTSKNIVFIYIEKQKKKK